MAKKKTKKSSKKVKPAKKVARKPVKKAVKGGLLSKIRLPSLSFGKKSSLNVKEVKGIEGEIRDLINWVTVFEKEYDLPKEVTDQLLKRLHSVARKVGWLKCS